MNVYGLIGYPLGHSFSKQYFTEKFKREQITNASFELFPIETIEDLPKILQSNTALKGLCVTIPYKEQVLKFVDELSEEVTFIGATNSIKIEQHKLIAYNTDIIGFEISFSKLLRQHHKKALILGTGGASKAVQYVLQKLNIAYLIVSRNIATSKLYTTYNSIDEKIMTDYTVIINCTPVGMYPKDHEFPPIPYCWITPQHYVYDLVYKPLTTVFLEKAAQKGATTENGFEMLTLQAEASWKIWNDF